MENLGYLSAYVLVLLTALLSRLEGAGLEREVILSSLRALFQLLLLAYLLGYILGVSSLFAQFLILLSMSLFASFVFLERSKSPKLFPVAFISISMSFAFPIVLLLWLGALRGAPHELIPFGGLIIGNTLNTLSLFYDRLVSEIRNRREEIEAYVALGAPLRLALHPVITDSIKMAMIPKLNWLKSAGVVHIPGVAVGMLVAGASPLKAILFQLVILYTLLFSGILGSSVLAFLGLREIFKQSFRLR
ncbi:MAG: iron export ABC transporter permease subunit FetB [Aquificae bacterium]|nr:iron export ABC transporter permease subunit FetB [Aquificota bacterium]